MCPHPTDSAKEFGINNNNKGRLERPHEKSQGEKFFVNLWRCFGHYKAGLASDHICFLEALLSTLVVKRGIVLERWSSGLSVMLEKVFGCSLITKLQSILLIKADFNASNKIIYGMQMLDNVRKYKLMLEELFSKRNWMADDGTLLKLLFYDIV
jgi:hypothetical protein